MRGREAVQCAAQHGNAPEAAAALAAEQWKVLEAGVAQQVLELLAVLLQPPVARPRRALEEERALPLPVQLGEDVGLLAVLLAAARLPASTERAPAVSVGSEMGDGRVWEPRRWRR